ncbi:hypothetical protein NMY22_g13230 [Coprinellus aureogranulatus]|nr:hypothetical protein NMY22_g13230 [Coprinellus aureogranulatus]
MDIDPGLQDRACSSRKRRAPEAETPQINVQGDSTSGSKRKKLKNDSNREFRKKYCQADPPPVVQETLNSHKTQPSDRTLTGSSESEAVQGRSFSLRAPRTSIHTVGVQSGTRASQSSQEMFPRKRESLGTQTRIEGRSLSDGNRQRDVQSTSALPLPRDPHVARERRIVSRVKPLVHEASLTSQLAWDRNGEEDDLIEREETVLRHDNDEWTEGDSRTLAHGHGSEERDVSSRVSGARVHNAVLTSDLAGTYSDEDDSQWGGESRNLSPTPALEQDDGFDEEKEIAPSVKNVNVVWTNVVSQLADDEGAGGDSEDHRHSESSKHGDGSGRGGYESEDDDHEAATHSHESARDDHQPRGGKERHAPTALSQERFYVSGEVLPFVSSMGVHGANLTSAVAGATISSEGESQDYAYDAEDEGEQVIREAKPVIKAGYSIVHGDGGIGQKEARSSASCLRVYDAILVSQVASDGGTSKRGREGYNKGREEETAAPFQEAHHTSHEREVPSRVGGARVHTTVLSSTVNNFESGSECGSEAGGEAPDMLQPPPSNGIYESEEVEAEPREDRDGTGAQKMCRPSDVSAVGSDDGAGSKSDVPLHDSHPASPVQGCTVEVEKLALKGISVRVEGEHGLPQGEQLEEEDGPPPAPMSSPRERENSALIPDANRNGDNAPGGGVSGLAVPAEYVGAGSHVAGGGDDNAPPFQPSNTTPGQKKPQSPMDDMALPNEWSRVGESLRAQNISKDASVQTETEHAAAQSRRETGQLPSDESASTSLSGKVRTEGSAAFWEPSASDDRPQPGRTDVVHERRRSDYVDRGQAIETRVEISRRGIQDAFHEVPQGTERERQVLPLPTIPLSVPFSHHGRVSASMGRDVQMLGDDDMDLDEGEQGPYTSATPGTRSALPVHPSTRVPIRRGGLSSFATQLDPSTFSHTQDLPTSMDLDMPSSPVSMGVHSQSYVDPVLEHSHVHADIDMHGGTLSNLLSHPPWRDTHSSFSESSAGPSCSEGGSETDCSNEIMSDGRDSVASMRANISGLTLSPAVHKSRGMETYPRGSPGSAHVSPTNSFATDRSTTPAPTPGDTASFNASPSAIFELLKSSATSFVGRVATHFNHPPPAVTLVGESFDQQLKGRHVLPESLESGLEGGSGDKGDEHGGFGVPQTRSLKGKQQSEERDDRLGGVAMRSANAKLDTITSPLSSTTPKGFPSVFSVKTRSPLVKSQRSSTSSSGFSPAQEDERPPTLNETPRHKGAAPLLEDEDKSQGSKYTDEAALPPLSTTPKGPPPSFSANPRYPLAKPQRPSTLSLNFSPAQKDETSHGEDKSQGFMHRDKDGEAESGGEGSDTSEGGNQEKDPSTTPSIPSGTPANDQERQTFGRKGRAEEEGDRRSEVDSMPEGYNLAKKGMSAEVRKRHAFERFLVSRLHDGVESDDGDEANDFGSRKSSALPAEKQLKADQATPTGAALHSEFAGFDSLTSPLPTPGISETHSPDVSLCPRSTLAITSSTSGRSLTFPLPDRDKGQQLTTDKGTVHRLERESGRNDDYPQYSTPRGEGRDGYADTGGEGSGDTSPVPGDSGGEGEVNPCNIRYRPDNIRVDPRPRIWTPLENDTDGRLGGGEGRPGEDDNIGSGGHYHTNSVDPTPSRLDESDRRKTQVYHGREMVAREIRERGMIGLRSRTRLGSGVCLRSCKGTREMPVLVTNGEMNTAITG